MEERKLDIVLVPMGLALMLMYHLWLLITLLRTPKRTVIGFNALVRERWVYSMMSDPLKNGTLVVQTLRNNLMAFTSLAATSITLSSIIGVFVSTTTNSKSSSEIVYGSKNPIINSVKHFSVLLCFLFAFLCNIQSIRYYSHVSFLMTLPAMTDHDDIDDDSHSRGDMVCYVARCLNRGSYFWSLGLRGFYLAFPLFLWTFGPIPMFACCCAMPGVLYFLDTTASFAVKLKEFPLKVKMMTTNHDVELPCH